MIHMSFGGIKEESLLPPKKSLHLSSKGSSTKERAFLM